MDGAQSKRDKRIKLGGRDGESKKEAKAIYAGLVLVGTGRVLVLQKQGQLQSVQGQ